MPTQENPRGLVEASLDLAVTPPVLWATFTDLDIWPRWSPGVRSACCISGTEWTLGASFQLDVDLPFPVRQWQGSVTLTQVQPTVAVAWEAQYPFDVIATLTHRFTPTAAGTLVTIQETHAGRWSWLYRLSGFSGQRRRQFAAALRNLKAYLGA